MDLKTSLEKSKLAFPNNNSLMSASNKPDHLSATKSQQAKMQLSPPILSRDSYTAESVVGGDIHKRVSLGPFLSQISTYCVL